MPTDIGQETPQPQIKEQSTQVPEIRTKFNDARNLGGRIVRVDKVRRDNGFYSMRATPLLSELYAGLSDIPDIELNPNAIRKAMMSSFGLTLENARQIARGETIQGSRGIREDIDVLAELGRTIGQGELLANKLKNADRDAYEEIAKKIVAQELGKKPEEVEMTGEHLDRYISENYRVAKSNIIRQHEALTSYFRR